MGTKNNEFSDVTPQLQASLSAQEKKIKKGKLDIATGWGLIGSACAAIIDTKLYRAAHFNNWQEYFLHRHGLSPKMVENYVSAYREFGNTAVASLPIRSLILLLHSPQEYRDAVKKDTKKREQVSQMSTRELQQEVKAVKAAVAAKTPDRGDTSRRKKDPNDFFTQGLAAIKNDKKSTNIAANAALAQDRIIRKFHDHIVNFEEDLDILQEFVAEIGEVHFDLHLNSKESKLVDKMTGVLDTVYDYGQHCDAGARHINIFIENLEEKVARDKGHTDMNELLQGFVSQVEEMRSAIARFDSLLKNHTNLVSIHKERKGVK